MVGLIQPKKWTRQPAGRLEVDRNNRLARGLHFAWLPTSKKRDLAHNFPIDVSNSSDYTIVKGYTWDRNQTSSVNVVGGVLFATSVAEGAAAIPFLSKTEFSTFALATPAGLGSLGGYQNRQTPFAVGNSNCFATGYSDSSKIWSQIGSNWVDETAAGTFIEGERACFGVTWQYGRSLSAHFFKNRRLIAAANDNGATATDSSSAFNCVAMGGYAGLGSNLRAWLGEIHCILAWNRTLTDSEAAAIGENPFQVFKRSPPRSYSFPKLFNFTQSPRAVAIRSKRQRTRQPQQWLKVDWSNPITNKLIWAFAPGVSAVDAVSGGKAAIVNPGAAEPIITAGRNGRALRTYGIGGSVTTLEFVSPRKPLLLGTSGFVLLGAFNGTNTAQYMWDNGTSPTVIPHYVGIASDGTASYVINSVPRSYTNAGAIKSFDSLGFRSVELGGTVSQYDLFHNGRVAPNNTGPTTLGSSYVRELMRSDTFGQWNEAVLFAYWDRSLNSAEFLELAKNPWQIFQRAPSRYVSLAIAPPTDLSLRLVGATLKKPVRARKQLTALNMSHPALAGYVRNTAYGHFAGAAFLAPNKFNLWPATEGNFDVPAALGTVSGSPGFDLTATGSVVSSPIITTETKQCVLVRFRVRSLRESFPRIYDNGIVRIYVDASNGALGITGGGSSTFTSAAGTIEAGKDYTVAMSADFTSPGASPILYLNGASVSMPGTSSGSDFPSSVSVLFGNSAASAGDRTMDGVFAMGLVRFGATWTPALLKSLSADPWQIFKPRKASVIGFSPSQETPLTLAISTSKRSAARQPKGAVKVNYANPLTRGIHAAWSASYPHIELVWNQTLDVHATGTPGNNSGFDTYRGMIAPNFNDAGGIGGVPIHAAADRYDIASTPLTIAAYCRLTAAQNNGRAIIRANGSVEASYTVGLWGGTNNGAMAYINTTGGILDLSPSVTGELDPTVPTLVTLSMLGTTASLWAAKAVARTGTLPSSSIYYEYGDVGRRLFMGPYKQSGAEFNARTFCSFIWRRALSYSEHRELELNPWQLFKADKRVVYSTNNWPFDESVRPNAVQLLNLSGAYTDIDDDPSAADASWLTET